MICAPWQYRYAFSLRISTEFYVMAIEIRVFTADFYCILRSDLAPQIRNVAEDFYVFWHPRFVFSLGLSGKFCVLAPQILVCALLPERRIH